jgi:hypothetical protein
MLWQPIKRGEMPMICRMKFVPLFLPLFLVLSGVADAQTVFLARKALGKVRQLTGEMKGSQQPGYDIATVLLEARADKVYGTAVNMLQAKKDVNISASYLSSPSSHHPRQIPPLSC